jgi:hypothetical protein
LSANGLNEKVEQIRKTLEEVLYWIKLANKPTLKSTLIQELDSVEKKKVYELTDGYNSQYDIESLTKVSRRMVGYYWQKWYSLGVVIKSEQRKGRMQKLVSLDEIGITVTQEREESLVEFKPKYLKNILGNPKIFSDKYQLFNFANSILKLNISSIDNSSKEDIINRIIDDFERNDRVTQSLFMQTLEIRTKEIQSDEFNKYFQAWEKQISK